MNSNPPPRLPRAVFCRSSAFLTSFIRRIFRALSSLCFVCLVCSVCFGCSELGEFTEAIPFSEETLSLRVDNVSQFDYEALYAHMTPTLNIYEARKLNRQVIPSKTFTEITWPRGAYLTAVRRLVARGPRVAIRSEEPLFPSDDVRLLRLLDEGFVLVDSSEEPPL